MLKKICFVAFTVCIASSCSNMKKQERILASFSKGELAADEAAIALRPKQAWDQYNNPKQILTLFEANYMGLPKSGTVTPLPWSDTYWPTVNGGIAYRWQVTQKPFSQSIPTKDQIKKMTSGELNKLSPAEKYDIYMGRYDFPTLNAEIRRTSIDAEEWEGLCHGWAPASLFFSEPKSAILTNVDGVKIPFTVSDIKALLIYYVASRNDKAEAFFVGRRCNAEGGVSCEDANAGAFHVLITNAVKNKIPLIIDIDNGHMVWNQPIAGYQILSEVEEKGKAINVAPGTVKRMRIKMRLTYGAETQPRSTGNNFYTKAKDYEYILELDSLGKIIGGNWISTSFPDFLWTRKKPDFIDPYFGKIEEVLKKSLATGGNESAPSSPLPANNPVDNSNDSTPTISTIRSNYYVTAKNGYSHNYCWPADREGKIIGNQMADLKNCQSRYVSAKYGYSNYYCWPADKDGNILGNQVADLNNCIKGYVSAKNGYSNYYCWPSDGEGHTLGTQTVDNNKCQSSDNGQRYVSAKNGYSDYYCWNSDQDGNILGREMADIKNCHSGYMSAKKGYSDYYCWPTDKDGNILGREMADLKICHSGYMSAKKGYSDYYCWPTDKDGNILGRDMADLKICQTGFVSAKKGYSSYHCWPSDKDGNVLGNQMTDDSNCTRGYRLLKNGYSVEKCWPVDENENVLGNSYVDMNLCTGH